MTPELNVQIKQDLHTRNKVEGNVYRSHVSDLQDRCYSERMQKRRMEYNAGMVRRLTATLYTCHHTCDSPCLLLVLLL